MSGGFVWVANVNPATQRDSVTELNARSGSLLRVINDSTDGFNFNSPVAMSASGFHVWVGNVDSITELDSSNGSLVRDINAKADALNGPQSIAVIGAHLWVSNYNTESVTELNVGKGSLSRIIH